MPALTAHAIDQTGTLDERQLQALEAQLRTLEQKRGSQVAVLMVRTTAPEDIAAYAHRVASEWKIGRREVGDGVLLVVAKDDRRMRIEVARALEGAIPDIAAARIIDSEMKPRFRQNDYAGGLAAAVTQLDALIAGEALPGPGSQGGTDGMALWVVLAVVFFAVVGLSSLVHDILGGMSATLLVSAGAAIAVLAGGGGLIFTLGTALLALAYNAHTALDNARAAAVQAANAPAIENSARRKGKRGKRRSIVVSSGSSSSSSSSSSSGSWSSSSDSGSSGGFSSGGGGDFGGGGASGDW